MNFSFDSYFASQLDEDKIELLWLISKSDWHFFVKDDIFWEIREKVKVVNKNLYNILKKTPLKFLNTVKVGIDFSVQDAIKLIKTESKILVENAINDWSFIEKMINCLCKLKSNYLLDQQQKIKWVKEAIDAEYVEPLSGGGCSQIPQIADWCRKRKKFKNIMKYKFIAIFDSDKGSNEASKIERFSYQTAFALAEQKKPKSKNTMTSEDLKKNIDRSDHLTSILSNNIHILKKRETENYIPKTHVENALKESKNDVSEILKKYKLDQDYTDLGNVIKKQAPKLFKQSTAEELIAQAGNNGAEFIEIIEKIAKII